MNLLDVYCYNVKERFWMIFDNLIIKCCYNCEKFSHIIICGLNGY